MYDRFRDAGLGWGFRKPDGGASKVHFGPLAIVDQLLKSDSTEELFKMYPGAIGIDMEAGGAIDAASRAETEWIAVKSVSDLATRVPKSDARELAAASAASFLEHVLSDDNLLDGISAVATYALDEAHSESPVGTSKDGEQPKERGEKPTVVVVEDDQFFGQTVAKGLHDFSVEILSSAEETIQYFREARQCDALVLDIMMPAPEGQQEETDHGMSTGLWLLRKIKESAPKDLPVVIYTNRAVEYLGTQLEDIGLSPERTKIHTKLDTPPSKLRETIRSLIASEKKQTQDARTTNLPFLNEVAPAGTNEVAQFVGRKRELELLKDSSRSGKTTVVYGDRGIGKTSLAYALQYQLRERGEPSSKPLVCVIHSCVGSDSRKAIQFDDQLHILLQ
ncbi:MAG: hypothetical protein ACOVQM_19110, partial [Pirellula sp.]